VLTEQKLLLLFLQSDSTLVSGLTGSTQMKETLWLTAGK